MDVEDGFNAEDLFGGKFDGLGIFWFDIIMCCSIFIFGRRQPVNCNPHSQNSLLICNKFFGGNKST